MSISSVAVVGAGYMGGGIAQSLAQSGVACVLLDVVPGQAAARREGVVAEAEKLHRQGLVQDDQLARVHEKLSWSEDFEIAVAEADLVFEVVVEDLDVKRGVLTNIESCARDSAIIATNTSAIPIATLASALERPERFLGVHWFNPAPLLPGIELVPHATTDHALIAPVRDMLVRAGKEPAVVSDTPGFVCNRLQFALFREAARMVEDGVATPQEIDVVARASFGFRLALYGPFAVADMAGLDVYASAFHTLEDGLGERFSIPPSLQERIERGDLGIKTGGGYLGLSAEDARALIGERDSAYAQLGRLRLSLQEMQ